MVNNDFWYVDYCNNCKDLEVMDSKEIPCHHPWYCWHDDGEVQQLEYELNILHEKERLKLKLTAEEKERYFQLKQKKFELVKQKVREYKWGN